MNIYQFDRYIKRGREGKLAAFLLLKYYVDYYPLSSTHLIILPYIIEINNYNVSFKKTLFM